MAHLPKAKVFISCGQASSEERRASESISTEISRLGFEPYVAVQQQTLRGLKDNIFSQLSDSEYFLFVDFRREVLPGSDVCRGSLFSHQELAIASYLDLRFLGFRQRDVGLEGVLSFLQGNCVPFDEPDNLPALVRYHIDMQQWDPRWRNKLKIEREPGEYHETVGSKRPHHRTRWFHVSVRNLNKHKSAIGCRAYIKGFSTRGPAEDSDGISQGRTVEMRWGGYTFSDVIIPPGSCRDLDVGHVSDAEPNVLQFLSFTHSDYYRSFLRGPGDFGIDFVVISENFPEAQINVEMTLGESIEDAWMV